MKNETAIAAIRQVYKGAFYFAQYVDAENNIRFGAILQPSSDPFIVAEHEADTFTEAVEGVIQKVIGMIPVRETVIELDDFNEELTRLIPTSGDCGDLEQKQEQTMARIIDIRDCIR